MSVTEIERDMDTYVSDRTAKIRAKKPTPQELWFQERPELYRAARSRTLAHEGSAQAILDYLEAKHDFPFGISSFRALIRAWKMEVTKGEAA